MDIEQRIKAMHDEELKRLVDSLNFMLSGATIGEAEAFEMMAELEAVAVAEYRARGLGGDVSSNQLGGLPDEQQAGYIA